MISLTKPLYSLSQVKKAGGVLKNKLPLTAKDDVVQWFEIAHNWRASHIWPMKIIRGELSRIARRQEPDVLVAARLKRMPSIRKKLPTRSLNHIQDIAGCRAIFASNDHLAEALRYYTSGGSRHLVSNLQYDYISTPKGGGYRSHHLVLQYRGEGKYEAWNGMRVEVQLRTRLQHAWATAVEAVGLFLDQDLKGSQGDKNWLRLFQLMASEIAAIEHSPLVPGTSADTQVRREEIQQLNDHLRALTVLESFREAINKTEKMERSGGKYYLIQYDRKTKIVNVQPYSSWKLGAAEYDKQEMKKDPSNAVLVEVDKVEDLKKAYPNYFLDVAEFSEGLSNVLVGKAFRAPSRQTGQVSAQAYKPDYRSILADWNRRR